MNYSDMMKDKEISQYFSYLNNTYIEMSGPSLRVFKLDKKATVLDDLYGFEKTTRIYLPPFPIRALYKTNPWDSIIDDSPFEEKEENINFIVNLDNMVSIIRGLVDKHVAELKINYVNILKVPSMEKSNNSLNIYLDGVLLDRIDLTTYRSVKQLSQKINTYTGFSSTYDVNDEVANIDDFILKAFKNQTLLLYTKNNAYKNCTDAIEVGDLILTDKWRLYEVKQANPTGDMGWNYATYLVKCNLIELDVADGLPGEFRRMIAEHQYGLPKVKLE